MLTNISTLLSVVLQFLVSNWTRDFFLESLTLIISLLFHVGQPKQAGGTALGGLMTPQQCHDGLSGWE